MRLINFFSDFFSLIFPNQCEACGGLLPLREHIICATCRRKMPYTGYCQQQGNPMEQSFRLHAPVENVCALFFVGKKTPYSRLVHQLKYHSKPYIGVALGQELGNELAKVAAYSDVDFIIPIPLHAKRERKRGYNQSERIAAGISLSTGKPVRTDVVLRQRYNETQTKKNREERSINVSGIFAVHPEVAPELLGKHILLVDDVLTTGSTVASCIGAILSAASCRVSVATLGVAV
ncbi:MAG: double zinc ribbon domain-containing protein [Prevotellaceae bacterium]|nr:double zinc ribbon domain-containing protein [Prevotellaceae bacterium]